jgi:hypothetical protein
LSNVSGFVLTFVDAFLVLDAFPSEVDV